ncbi:short-chain dehydrogenase/reductase SDR [Haematococcus lacustris]
MDHREQRAQVRLATLSGHVASTSAAPGRMLEGKTAIITGAGKGIGEAAALEMAAHGAAVVVCDLDGPAASSVVQRIQAAGGRAVAVQADVTSEDAPARIVEAAVKAFGGLDILVNNAGFTWDGVIQKMTPTQWEMMLKVHCTAPFRLIQAATPYMRDAGKTEAAGGGSPKPRSIVNISSTTGTHGNAGQANYATAKAGIIGLTKSVAKEWGPFGVRCNALAFGLIDTRLTRPKEGGEAIEVDGQKVALGIPGADSYWKSVMSQVPLRRAGSAEEAAGAIMMLVCPWAAYVTGQVIEVNGGSFM